jgi:hypothetical protein
MRLAIFRECNDLWFPVLFFLCPNILHTKVKRKSLFFGAWHVLRARSSVDFCFRRPAPCFYCLHSVCTKLVLLEPVCAFSPGPLIFRLLCLLWFGGGWISSGISTSSMATSSAMMVAGRFLGETLILPISLLCVFFYLASPMGPQRDYLSAAVYNLSVGQPKTSLLARLWMIGGGSGGYWI